MQSVRILGASFEVFESFLHMGVKIDLTRLAGGALEAELEPARTLSKSPEFRNFCQSCEGPCLWHIAALKPSGLQLSTTGSQRAFLDLF